MDTLPTDFPLRSYIGQRVQRLVEGSHFVELHLDAPDAQKGYVQFEGPVALKIPGKNERRLENEELVEGNTVFQPLLGTTVEDVERVSEKSCRFLFSNGWAIDLIGDSGYESYHLRVAGDSCDV